MVSRTQDEAEPQGHIHLKNISGYSKEMFFRWMWPCVSAFFCVLIINEKYLIAVELWGI